MREDYRCPLSGVLIGNLHILKRKYGHDFLQLIDLIVAELVVVIPKNYC